jgi:hypothetical protein
MAFSGLAAAPVLLAADKTKPPALPDGVVSLAATVGIPAVNRILAQRGTKTDVETIMATFASIRSAMVIPGVIEPIRPEVADEAFRKMVRSGVSVDAGTFARYVITLNSHVASPAFPRGLTAEEAGDQFIAGLRQAVDKMPEIAYRDSPHVRLANLSDTTCAWLNWGGTYVGVAGMAIVSVPVVGQVMGAVGVAAWAVSMIGGC